MSDEAKAQPYPPVGKIAVMESGCRVAIWPDESDNPSAFTGQLLDATASIQTARALNLSCCWARSRIAAIEDATDIDKSLCLMDIWAEAGT